MEISKEFKFSASHILPRHPGLCSNLHGHNWYLIVFVRGPIDPSTGMVMDYADISAAVEPLIKDLDHGHLGAWTTPKVEIYDDKGTKSVPWLRNKDFGGMQFNPTSENLIVEIARQLLKKSFVFSRLQLKETDTVNCELTWEEFNAIRR